MGRAKNLEACQIWCHNTLLNVSKECKHHDGLQVAASTLTDLDIKTAGHNSTTATSVGELQGGDAQKSVRLTVLQSKM